MKLVQETWKFKNDLSENRECPTTGAAFDLNRTPRYGSSDATIDSSEEAGDLDQLAHVHCYRSSSCG
jgi:hypothetical protein